jgi:hypothetical protein
VTFSAPCCIFYNSTDKQCPEKTHSRDRKSIHGGLGLGAGAEMKNKWEVEKFWVVDMF